MGRVCVTNHLEDLVEACVALVDEIAVDGDICARCTTLFEQKFAVRSAVAQIERALRSN